MSFGPVKFKVAKETLADNIGRMKQAFAKKYEE